MSNFLTSADIEDGKVEYDPVTKIRTEYKHIEGGYEVHKTIPQPNGTIKTQTQTFYDPKPCSEEDLRKEAENRKTVQQRMNKEVRIDKNTTMFTKAIEGGYEEIYTTTNADGTISKQTKTFFDSMSPDDLAKVQEKYKKSQKDKSNTEVTNTTQSNKTTDSKKKLVQRNSSVESTDASESHTKTVKKQHSITQSQDKHGNIKQQATVEESRRVTENLEYTENNRTVRKNSVQEQHIRAVTQNTNSIENKDTSSKSTKSKKKTRSAIPPPPADFVQNETTTINSKKVNGGVEYTYSTILESGETITTKKIIYEEEVHEADEEEEQSYKKSLKEAEKHKNVTAPKKLKSTAGIKKIVPSENPGEVTTVEEIRVDGATEFHYTIVNADGIVKKIVKTVYDTVATHSEEYEEHEVVEDYEEEIYTPGEKNIRTIESVQQLPRQFEEEVTITSEKKEKKVKKSTMISA